MTEAPTAAGSAPRADVIIDVWSRTAPKYRRRAVIMLIVLAALFAGLCTFTFWLRTGVAPPWRYDRYGDLMYRSFTPVGPQQVTLNDFLSAPINVRQVPIHSVIMGLLLATLSSIPILVMILYRLPFALPFAAMVVFLAVMPWLGITASLGCLLACIKPFRFSFRYATALLGLVPVGIYFVTASWEPAGQGIKPVQPQALLYAPWVLALLSSCVICAVALAVARLINYRPGGIPPVLAALFALPVLLFHYRVGRDELEYRVLEQEIAVTSPSLFSSLDVGALQRVEAARKWSQREDRTFEAIWRSEMRKAEEQARRDAEQARVTGAARCDWYIDHFSHSRYVPNALFLKGQALDRRLHLSRLERLHHVEYRSDAPSPASRPTWETIAERFPESPLAAVALYKLAILDARDGRIAPAAERLAGMIRRFDARAVATQPVSPPRSRLSVFERSPAAEALGVDARALVLEAKRLEEMLRACAADVPRPAREVLAAPLARPDEPLHPAQLLMRLDETHPAYEANLEGIVQAFSESVTAGFVEVRLVLLEPAVSRRLRRFENTAMAMGSSPAGAEALYRLAEALQEDSLLGVARAAYEQLLREHADSCWAAEAKERLSALAMLESVASR